MTSNDPTAAGDRPGDSARASSDARPEPDDALSWSDEADSSHIEGPSPAARARSRRRVGDAQDEPVADEPVVDEPDVDEPDADEPDDDGPVVMTSASLVVHGVLGGVFLLWAAGWIVAVGDFTNPFTDAVSSLMWNLGELFAVAAPLAWFVAVIALVPVRRGGRRLALMALGALLVAPWPLVIGGGA